MSLNESNDISQLKKFDVDLQFGKQWEVFVDDLFSGAKTCEVKTERDQWADTGNIFVEFECNGVPSGIASTTSVQPFSAAINRSTLYLSFLSNMPSSNSGCKINRLQVSTLK